VLIHRQYHMNVSGKTKIILMICQAQDPRVAASWWLHFAPLFASRERQILWATSELAEAERDNGNT